jgi:hypothetical protein
VSTHLSFQACVCGDSIFQNHCLRKLSSLEIGTPFPSPIRAFSTVEEILALLEVAQVLLPSSPLVSFEEVVALVALLA